MQDLRRPFRSGEQRAAGRLTARELSRFHCAVFPGVWAPRGVELSLQGRAHAAWLWSGRRAVLAGLTAAALHGARWVDHDAPVELIHRNRRPPAGIVVRSDAVPVDEVTTVGGLPTTTPARTAFDLARTRGTDDAVRRLDALVRATGVTAADVEALAGRHRGARGVRRLARVLPLVDGGAESPYETTTRLLLVRRGFPPPTTQIAVRDARGVVVARLDMGWPQWQVAVEYDGAQHWTDARQRAWDIDRAVLLDAAGWTVVRVSAAMLARPQVIVDRVAAAVAGHGRRAESAS